LRDLIFYDEYSKATGYVVLWIVSCGFAQCFGQTQLQPVFPLLNCGGDNVIDEVMLELHQTPRFSRADVVMSRPQDEQIRHDTQCERLLRSTDVAGHLMLAESQVAAQLAE